METGDLLLFDGSDWSFPLGPFRFLIKYFTNSDWSHIGIIVKDPEFTSPPLKGLYVWDSSFTMSDSEDHEMKLGIHFSPLEKVIEKYNGTIYWRKLNRGNVKITNEKLGEIHRLVHNKPYDVDPVDWFEALMERKIPRTNSRYFCSAFVARIYSFLGLIDSNIDWTIIRPSHFSTENPDDPLHIQLLHGASLGPEIKL